MNRIELLGMTNPLLKLWKKWKHVFIACLLINLLSYGSYIVQTTYAVDDYAHIFGKSNTIETGRWVIDLVHNFIYQTSLMPTITPLLYIVIGILSGIGLCELWKIEKRTSTLVIALFSIHPYLLDVYNVRFAALSLALGYFVTIIAILVSTKKKYGIFFAVIFLYLALSIYQPVLGFAIAAIMIQVLLMGFREHFSAESIRDGAKLFVRYLFILGLSVIVYLVVTKLIFIIFNIEANSRLQAGFISDVDQLKAKIAVVISVLFVRLGPVKEFVLPFIGKLAIFVIYIGGIIAVIKRSPKFSLGILALLWLALIPLGAISFLFPIEALSIPWRVCMGLVVFFVGMIALTQECDSQIIRKASSVIGYFLIAYLILNNNTILYKQHLTNQRDLFMGNQIIARIQSLDDYQPGMDLAIIGKTKKEDFSKEGKTNVEIIREYIRYCSVRRYSLAKSAFEADWSKYAFLLNYMDVELKRCNPKKVNRIQKFTAGRKPWPNRSSVFIQDDTVVLILSENDG